MLEHALLYFIPSQGRDDIAEGGEFLKIQPGTGDGLTLDDIDEGYTNYVIWNRFRPECLDIDGELPMECIDSGMILLKEDSFDVLGKVLNDAYGQNAQKSSATRTLVFVLPRRMGVRLRHAPGAIPLLW